jgi:hypothetical protein
VVHREHLVPKKVLGACQLTLGLSEVALAGEYAPESNSGVCAKPCSGDAEVADDRLCALRVTACDRTPPAIDGNERQRRPGKGMAGRPVLDVRMLDRPHRSRPRVIELSCEVERARIGAKSGHDGDIDLRLREVDRAPAGLDCTPDVSIECCSSDEIHRRANVRSHAIRMLALSAVRELEVAPSLEIGVTEHRDRRRRAGGDLRMLDDPLVIEHPRPPQQGTDAPARHQ